MAGLSKIFIFIGIVFIIIGILVGVFGRIPWLGRLPGDILIKRENTYFYFPIATSIIVSIILSLIMYYFNKR
ncbi:MAG: DUF2905 domain-containing protein [Candidatus Omnitrophica bacterium]|nr:DUF2905 domain-containing protein [Candidatus Omnitrophota bacterium]MBU1997319.1 DUF2905 domain-containing protein [Candidatus Omnitrophota bacterium]MBU4334324.1 DUF2905 domain-containing protein [Candidatus Omnitrophota bacterium]